MARGERRRTVGKQGIHRDGEGGEGTGEGGDEGKMKE